MDYFVKSIILITKHDQINIHQKIIKLDKTFKYYCFDCNKIFNEEHQNHYSLNYDKFVIYLNNYAEFIFEKIKNMKFLKEEIIQILDLIFYASLNYIDQGYYEYYLNLQNLVVSMTYCLNNNDIDDKKDDFNYIISNYSNKKNSNKIIVNKESEIEEFCEVYFNKKK